MEYGLDQTQHSKCSLKIMCVKARSTTKKQLGCKKHSILVYCAYNDGVKRMMNQENPRFREQPYGYSDDM